MFPAATRQESWAIHGIVPKRSRSEWASGSWMPVVFPSTRSRKVILFILNFNGYIRAIDKTRLWQNRYHPDRCRNGPVATSITLVYPAISAGFFLHLSTISAVVSARCLECGFSARRIRPATSTRASAQGFEHLLICVTRNAKSQRHTATCAWLSQRTGGVDSRCSSCGLQFSNCPVNDTSYRLGTDRYLTMSASSAAIASCRLDHCTNTWS
jgi:hypothetical protein